MRIGIVIDEFNPARGGMEEWCRQFVFAVARRDHELHIVADRFGDMPLPEQVTCHALPRTKSRVRFANAAARRVQELQLDIVHDMGAGWQCDIFQPHGGSYHAWLARQGDMYPAWHWALKRPFDALLPKRRDALEHCRRQFARNDQTDKTFLALANTVANDFVHYHHVPPKQIKVIYNGVDCRRYSPDHRALHRDTIRRNLGISEDTVVLMLATHNFRRKGLAELLATAGRLAADGRPVHVMVAGRGRFAKWRMIAARHGVADRLTFIGGVSNMVPYYSAADVYVHPTYYDQCSLVILEAAASGLPIVTTRNQNGTAELFREGDEALTVADPRDADGLYERLDALFDEQLRIKLGLAARNVALRNPFERNVAEILAVYEEKAGPTCRPQIMPAAKRLHAVPL